MKELKTYKCDYCKYISDISHLTKAHEEDCDYNPGNKTCNSCKFKHTSLRTTKFSKEIIIICYWNDKHLESIKRDCTNWRSK